MRVAALVLAGLVVLGASREARAQTTWSAYERESIQRAERAYHNHVDPHPEGKTIEAIDVMPLEVIEDRDLDVPEPFLSASGFAFLPDLNALHTTSKPYVIRREVLQKVGEPWSQELVDETARNLRLLPQLSLVVVVAFRGSRADRVRMVVIAKDVWSLRMGTQIALSSAGLESLLVEPTESNLAGTHQLVLGRFIYQPRAFSLGAAYRENRVQNRHLTFTADANIIMSSARGSPEGTFGDVVIARPLYSTRAEWSWGVNTVWRSELLRRYIGTRVASFDAEVTPEKDLIPYEYRTRRISETAAVTRSYGTTYKNDFSIGAEINRRAFHTEFESAVNASPAALDEFVRKRIPVSDTRVGPFIQWRSYTTRFLRTHDVETLALEENVRLGHDLWLKLYPVTEALGSSRNFIGTYAAAQYTIPLGDGYTRASVETTTEMESTRISDASIEVDFRVVSPRLPFARLVSDMAVFNRYRNYLNRTSFLGGDGRLRGYPSNFFSGKDVVAYNLELRTNPVQILRFQVGAAAFYDAGDAFDGFDHLRPHQSAGVGLRTLIPQVERFVFRTDFAFPLERPLPAGVSSFAFFFSFEQAFGIPAVGSTAAQGVPASLGALGQ